MLTHDTPPAAATPAAAAPAEGAAQDSGQGTEHKVRIIRISGAGTATVAGAGLGSLGLVSVLYERVLPFTGALGFWVSWYVVFLLLYATMARMQWDWRDVQNRIMTVALASAGILTTVILASQILYTLVRGLPTVLHLNTWTQSLVLETSQSALNVGGDAHAIIGTLEQISIATLLSVPLALAAAVFLSEVGGPLARPVRIIVEAMTSLPDIIAGLFIYALFILTLGFQKSGFAAALALAVTMMPIITRASEVMLRLVPGTLREASFALGASQWRTVLNVVLPSARSGLATAVVLGMARGIGETAPVLVVSGLTKDFNVNPFSGPQVSLPLFTYDYAGPLGVGEYIARAFGAGVALLIVVLLLFWIARTIGGSAPGELTKRQRRRLARQGARV